MEDGEVTDSPLQVMAQDNAEFESDRAQSNPSNDGEGTEIISSETTDLEVIIQTKADRDHDHDHEQHASENGDMARDEVWERKQQMFEQK